MASVPQTSPSLACVTVGPDDFDVSTEVARLRAGDHRVGAVVTFVGTVREWRPDAASSEGAVMELEHYPGMTELSIARMIDAAKERFDVFNARVIHRVGPLAIADQIVLVAVTSAHRGQAFQCCEFLMDWLKTDAPFWKKEVVNGQGQWVDARASDDQAMDRWRQG
ncbi:molybdenum cofactor biosynthesis protein MoaE [Aquabacterium sp.]|uniref:molybdenum cofactor biosynthesis protein MoaE n=1 Tax=Aquabacterium sp. TaxID=1872578 RepID=UPI002E2F2286|nr:molybdenum cofactor biosynthesis protein MoaE [Aquabacterium sp.]HEX5310679.1 molybdenum cofactor biosynthesis protein MoaE [Aquabacterium sp.]